MKKLLLMAGLVMALLLPMTVPASAAEGTAAPVIETQVPERISFRMNPYRLYVQTEAGTTQDAIISETKTFSNLTPAALSVSASVSGAVRDGSDLQLVSSPEALDWNAKSAFLWLEFQNVADGQEPVWSGEYTGARNQAALNGGARPVLELPASVDGEASEAAFRVFGMLGVPTEGMWTAQDSVDMSLLFEFEPIEDEEASLYGVIFPEIVEDAEPSEDEAQPVENEEVPVEDAQPVEDVTPVEDAQPVEEEDPVEDAESSEDEAQPVEEEEAPVEDAESSEDEAQPVKNEEVPVEDAQPVEDVTPVEDAQPVEEEEAPVEDAQPVEDVTPVEDAQPVEEEEAPVEDTEPVEDAEPQEVEEA